MEYGFWGNFLRGRQAFKMNYPVFATFTILSVIALIALGITLNQVGARRWNLAIGVLLGLVILVFALKPGLLEKIGMAGIVGNAADGKNESLQKELAGSVQLIGKYTRLVSYVVVVIQTMFMMLAIKRFEDVESAFIAVVAAATFGLLVYALKLKGKWLATFMVWFWGILMVVSILAAFFVPNYFKDELDYEIRHAQGQQAAAQRIELAAPIEAKAKAGIPLTLAERVTLQNLGNQKRAAEALLQGDAEVTIKVASGLPEQGINLAITPGGYTCKAELTAKDPRDLAVTINGIGVDLATTAYVNGQACNGKAKVDFGPDGQAILHWNLDGDARVQVRGATRWVRLSFTPA